MRMFIIVQSKICKMKTRQKRQIKKRVKLKKSEAYAKEYQNKMFISVS